MLVALLAACSGGNSGPSYASPHDIASALDCTTSYDEEPGAIAPADVATCRFEGEQVTLVVGDDVGQRDATITMASKLARKFGARGEASAVVGGTWAVLTESPDTAEDAQAKVGGEVRG